MDEWRPTIRTGWLWHPRGGHTKRKKGIIFEFNTLRKQANDAPLFVGSGDRTPIPHNIFLGADILHRQLEPTPIAAGSLSNSTTLSLSPSNIWSCPIVLSINL